LFRNQFDKLHKVIPSFKIILSKKKEKEIRKEIAMSDLLISTTAIMMLDLMIMGKKNKAIHHTNLTSCWLMPIPKYICLDKISTCCLTVCNYAWPHLSHVEKGNI
jgi:hypothetical protein